MTADSVYGVGGLEMLLRRLGKRYVLGVSATQPFNSWIDKPEVAGTAEEIAHDLECPSEAVHVGQDRRRHPRQRHPLLPKNF